MLIRFRKRLNRKMLPTVSKLYSLRNRVCSLISRNAVTAYWYPENNFGDQLTPDILHYYGFKPLYTPIFTSCEVISVGSILEVVPETYTGTILGSGFISSTTKSQFRSAKIALVRGKLTAAKLSLPCTIPLGDPGILVDEVYGSQLKSTTKKHILGIIPHYKHIDDPGICGLARMSEKDTLLIDARRKPLEVIRDIASCHYVASSSLHGIVVAHSLGIPVVLLEVSGVPLRGGRFKFEDYFSVFNKIPQFHVLNNHTSLEDLCGLTHLMDPELVEKVKQDVRSAFLSLRSNCEN